MTEEFRASEDDEREYRVVWEIDVSASCPVEAAKTARDVIRDAFSAATIFRVTGPDSQDPVEVDLSSAVAVYVSCRPPHERFVLSLLLDTEEFDNPKALRQAVRENLEDIISRSLFYGDGSSDWHFEVHAANPDPGERKPTMKELSALSKALNGYG